MCGKEARLQEVLWLALKWSAFIASKKRPHEIRAFGLSSLAGIAHLGGDPQIGVRKVHYGYLSTGPGREGSKQDRSDAQNGGTGSG